MHQRRQGRHRRPFLGTETPQQNLVRSLGTTRQFKHIDNLARSRARRLEGRHRPPLPGHWDSISWLGLRKATKPRVPAGQAAGNKGRSPVPALVITYPHQSISKFYFYFDVFRKMCDWQITRAEEGASQTGELWAPRNWWNVEIVLFKFGPNGVFPDRPKTEV